MKFKGFEAADFDLFLIDGLEERMEVLKSQLRPKLHNLGEDLKDDLSAIVGYEIFPHVAKHARRKTNPPNDSWVAFGGYRGYKMVPHFQITIWNTHVLVQWGIIYEAKNKERFADSLSKYRDEIKSSIPKDFQWSKNHMKPEGKLMKDMSNSDFEEFANRLKFNKNGEVMVGRIITREEALQMGVNDFYNMVLESWKSLNKLHQLAK